MPVRKLLQQPFERCAQYLIIGLSSFCSSNLLAYEYIDEASLSDEPTIVAAINKGEASLNFRLRYEDARQDSEPEQGGQAATLRSRLSFQTQRYHLFSAFLQFEDVTALPDDDNYFSGGNGEFDDVLIGDPTGTRVSQAQLNYDIANTLFSYGRQAHELNTGRMIGTDDWYQRSQSYTGLSVANQSLNYTTVSLARFGRVEQPYAKDGVKDSSPIDIRLYSVNYNGFLLNDFSIYHLDISDYPRDRRWETKTTGIFFSGMAGGNNGIADSKGNREGEDFSISYLFEFAKQSDSGKNPSNYNANYWHVRLGAGYQGLSLTYGREVLGAKSGGSFVTPLANMHDHQGYTGQAVDQSLGSVQGGIVDSEVELAYRCSDNFSASLAFHEFDFDRDTAGGKSIGSEYILSAEADFELLELAFGYADYSADDHGEDTRRAWLQAAVNF